MSDTPRPKGEPYCGNCGYLLTGATESSKCPECGKPLVEVLMRPVFQAKGGRRWNSQARCFGMPVISIAMGPHQEERIGRAKGFIAIGDIATGVIAMGGQARGVVAFGGLAIGGFSFGGMSLGLISSFGGMSAGGAAIGGFAVGGFAQGGGAIGYVAQGGLAIGQYARGGGAFGAHVISPGRGTSQAAVDMFDSLSWFFGSGNVSLGSMINAVIISQTPAMAVIVICGIMALLAIGKGRGQSEHFPR